MSLPDEHSESEDEAPEPKRNFRRELEDRATTAEQEANRLRRENTIYKAGLTNLTERQISVLASQIEGDPTPDSVRTLAAELGWAQQPADEGVPADEVATLERVTNASTGSTTSQPRENPEVLMAQALAEGGIDKLMEVSQSLGLPTTWSQQ